MQRTEQIISEAWAPPSDLSADLWVEQNCRLGHDSDIKGHVSFRFVPQTKFLLQKFQDNSVRRITGIVSTQSAKTKTAEFSLMWMVRNRPAPSIWYMDTEQSAKIFFKTRLYPDLEECEAIAEVLPTARHKTSQALIQFSTMNLYVLGAHSRRNRERITAANVFIDEARRLKPGALQEIDGRFKSIRNYKRFMFSTAGRLFRDEDGQPCGDELWAAFWNGTRHMLFWSCPHCGHKQTFRFGRDPSPLYPEARQFGGFVWDVNEKTMPAPDVYDFAELSKTVRYECENSTCRYRFKNAEKFKLIPTIEIQQGNPMASPEDISIHWWEAYMPWGECDWDKIVHKFLRAHVLAKNGDWSRMTVFITDTLGEPWEEQSSEKINESELTKFCDEYSVGEEWPPQNKTAKALTADIQHGFLVYVYRTYLENGESRLIDAGKLLGLDELRLYQRDKKILDRGVAIDCAHKPSQVFGECIKYGRWVRSQAGEIWDGWLPMLADDTKEFVRMEKGGGPVKVFWKEAEVDAGLGYAGRTMPLQRISWAKDHYLDLLYFFVLQGKTSKWGLPKNISPDYVRQIIGGYRRHEIRDAAGVVVKTQWRKHGRRDFADCELMQLVLCDVTGITRHIT